jgi:protein CpxP
MKKILGLMIAGAFAMSAVSVFAQASGPKGGAQGTGPGVRQGGPGQQGRGGDFMKRRQQMQAEVMKKLNLSKDQQTKIKALNDKFMKDIQALRASGGNNQEQNRQKMRDLSTKHREAFMKILTPEQRKKYDALVKEAREKMRKEMGNRGPSGQGGKPAGKPGTKPGGKP